MNLEEFEYKKTFGRGKYGNCSYCAKELYGKFVRMTYYPALGANVPGFKYDFRMFAGKPIHNKCLRQLKRELSFTASYPVII